MGINTHKFQSVRSFNRKAVRNITALLTGIGLSTTALADPQMVRNANVPFDVKQTCTANIGHWFGNGYVVPNGWVEPANSLNPIFADFANNTRCDFYRWGAQMFLWLNSGMGTKHVFNSAPTFYNVSVAEDGKRTYLAGNGPMDMTIRKGKTDEEIEVGQAGGSDILLAQNGALVYYSLHANDVFAMYSTGQMEGAFKSDATLNSEFPNTPSQLSEVSKFAQQWGYPLGPDKIALAMELKTSWVEASTLADPERYILTKAVVPVFDRRKDKGPWPVVDNKEKLLAMVGMHVVGTVNAHPEMVWATFEHVDNVPDNAYKYTNISGGTTAKPYNSNTNHWTFLPQGAALPPQIVASGQYATDPARIINLNNLNIEPSDNVRVDPWGNLAANQTSANIANNTDLASINLSVLSQLAPGDVRGNYIQTGGVWSAQGQIPTSGTDSVLRGSLNLANTTMETFYQYPNTSFNPYNCFGCHNTTDQSQTFKISHIYTEMEPLPKK